MIDTFKGLTKEKKLLYATITLLVVLLLVRAFGPQGTEPVTEQNESQKFKTVELVATSGSTGDDARIPTIGQIESLSEVEIRAQISERVTSVPVSIGDGVFAGQVVATLSTSDLEAQVRATEAGYTAAEAAFTDLVKGTRPEQLQITQSQVKNAQVAYENAQSSLNNSISSAYTTVDDVITNKTDILFSNPQSDSPELVFSQGSFQARTNVISERVRIQGILTNSSNTGSQDALQNLDVVISYLDILSGLVNNLATGAFSAGTVEGWRQTVSSAQTSAQSSKTALLAAQERAALAATTLEIAENQLSLAEAGATDEQLLSSQAQVDAARAQYQSSNLALNKAFIKSPISGTVSQVNVSVGELVTPGQLIARVVNTSGLKITTYVNERDVKHVSIGAAAYLNNAQIGSVSRIAPSINPDTKKVEVEIALANENNFFVVGQYVNVDIEVSGPQTTVPLTAIRNTTSGNMIFVVQDSEVFSVPVTIDRVFGEYASIKEDLSMYSHVVSKHQSVQEGDKVDTNS